MSSWEWFAGKDPFANGNK